MNPHNISITISPVNKVMDLVKSGTVNAVLTLLSTSELETFYKKEINEVIDYDYVEGNNFEGIEKYIKPEDWKIVKFEDYLGGEVREIPNKTNISEAISFGIKKIDEGKKLLVHCQMGMSRSPAIAYLILCHYMDPQDAINETYRIRPNIIPNKHIVEIGDGIMKLGGRAIDALNGRSKVKQELDKSFKYHF